MLSKEGENYVAASIWRNIAFDKVKQRIDLISSQIEEVIHKYEPYQAVGDFQEQQNNPPDDQERQRNVILHNLAILAGSLILSGL